jgi:hypothetical protein
MADRRPLNPRLVRALREAAVPPLDYITDDTKVVEVPYPAPQQPQQSPVEAQPQQQQAPAAPKSRFDVVREYLERTGGGSASPPAGVLPDEVDLRAAEEADALASTRAGLQAASAAFLGDRKAAFQDTASTRNVDRARALQAQRSKALADWVASQEQRRLDEARVLSGAMAEPSRKDPEMEKRRLDEQQAERERRQKQDEEELRLKRDKFEAEERRRKAGAGAAGKKADEKADAAKAKAAEGLAFGYELADGSNTTKAQREAHAKTVKSAQTMKGLVAKMRSALQGASKFDLVNPMSAKHLTVKPLITALQLEAKNVAELGALSGPDMGLMQSLALDPTSIWNIAKDPEASLSQLDSWADNTVNSSGEAFGIFLKGKAPGAAAPTQPTDVPTGKVPMISEATGATVFLSPAAAEKLEREGKVRKP